MMRNRTKVTIKGFNQERAINQIAKKIKVYNYKKEENGVSYFEVDYKHRKLLKNLLRDTGIEIIAFSSRGFKDFFKRFLHCYGIISALVVILAGYIVQYSFILKIEVLGREDVKNEQIEQFVEDALVTRFKSGIDTKQIEIDIMQEFEYVTSVSVAIIGQSLLISVNQVDIPAELGEDFAPIISQHDGRVSKINLIQGTLAVNEGDIVKKGDVLVYPYVIDSQGERRSSQPKADIYAEIWLEGVETHYDCVYKTQRTGRKQVYSEVYLNNLLIYSNNNDINFERWESESTVKSLSKNLLLPLKLRKTVVYETEVVEIKASFLEKKEQIIENARQKALIFLQENEIISTKYSKKYK